MNAHITTESEKQLKQTEKKNDIENIKKNFNWKLLLSYLLMLFVVSGGAYAIISAIRQTWVSALNIGIGIAIGVIATFVVMIVTTMKSEGDIATNFGINKDMVQGKCVSYKRTKRINAETKQKETVFIPIYEVLVRNKYMKIMGKPTTKPPKVGETCSIKLKETQKVGWC